MKSKLILTSARGYVVKAAFPVTVDRYVTEELFESEKMSKRIRTTYWIGLDGTPGRDVRLYRKAK